MVVKPKIRGFICTTAHPDGCRAIVKEQIEYVKNAVHSTVGSSPPRSCKAVHNHIHLAQIFFELTHPIYKDGSIGRAKSHLAETAKEITKSISGVSALSVGLDIAAVKLFREHSVHLLNAALVDIHFFRLRRGGR